MLLIIIILNRIYVIIKNEYNRYIIDMYKVVFINSFNDFIYNIENDLYEASNISPSQNIILKTIRIKFENNKLVQCEIISKE